MRSAAGSIQQRAAVTTEVSVIRDPKYREKRGKKSLPIFFLLLLATQLDIFAHLYIESHEEYFFKCVKGTLSVEQEMFISNMLAKFYILHCPESGVLYMRDKLGVFRINNKFLPLYSVNSHTILQGINRKRKK